MKKNIVFTIFFVLLSGNLFACLNGETKVLKNGLLLYHDRDRKVPQGHDFRKVDFTKVLKELDAGYAKTKDVDYLSDKGYIYILQKKYTEALQLYLNIEKTNPNRYTTASNLGTLYELMGDNQKALVWIKKSIAIDAKSHYGSEWLHVNILETKIDTKPVISKNLITTNFGTKDFPYSKLPEKEIVKLEQDLFYQLNERMSFIKPKDKIVAQLLFELANTKTLLKDYDSAKRIYSKATEYGGNSALLKKRMEYAGILAEKKKRFLAKG